MASLIAAQLGIAGRDDLDAPALALGVAGVHAQQVAGKQRRLVAAGAGADLEEDVALVVGVAGQQGGLQLGVDARLGFRADSSSAAASSFISGSERSSRAVASSSRAWQ
jgi:hypothetical protein